MPAAGNSSVRTFPVDAGAFHHNFVRLQLNHPLRQRAPVFLECAKLTLLNSYQTVAFFDQCAGRNLCLMHIESNNTFVKRDQFHN